MPKQISMQRAEIDFLILFHQARYAGINSWEWKMMRLEKNSIFREMRVCSSVFGKDVTELLPSDVRLFNERQKMIRQLFESPPTPIVLTPLRKRDRGHF